nr:oxygen-independent coproporphyrinogen III oxidase [bacterium]
EEAAALSLYVHIPFCDARCAFCGCSSIATRNGEIKTRYVDSCLREIEHLAQATGESCRLAGIHFGGGTPSSVGAEALGRIVSAASSRMGMAEGAELAIEIDPRAIEPEDIIQLCRIGFNRMSFGVQDFDACVGKAIGRSCDFERIRRLIDEAKEAGAGVNLDLIYGLPRQTAKSWRETLAKVALLSPDRVALFNFAYLPRRLPHQREIDAAALPGPLEKISLFASAIEAFGEAGYSFIGLDHFAREGDQLAVAHRAGKLTRNFQGYTAAAGVPIVGVGATSISEAGNLYAQNEKKLALYLQRIGRNEFATSRGALLAPEEEGVRERIRSLFCSQRAAGVPEDVRMRLEPLERDGLVFIDGDRVSLTPLGRLFPRQAAAAFDSGFDPFKSGYSRGV